MESSSAHCLSGGLSVLYVSGDLKKLQWCLRESWEQSELIAKFNQKVGGFCSLYTLKRKKKPFRWAEMLAFPPRGICPVRLPKHGIFAHIHKTWGFKKLTLHLSPFVLCCTVSMNILSVTLMFKFSCVLYNHENFYLPRSLRKIRCFLFSISNQCIYFSWKLNRRQLFLDFLPLPVSGAIHLKFSPISSQLFQSTCITTNPQGVVVRGLNPLGPVNIP